VSGSHISANRLRVNQCRQVILSRTDSLKSLDSGDFEKNDNRTCRNVSVTSGSTVAEIDFVAQA
jgi:hypothetical protein